MGPTGASVFFGALSALGAGFVVLAALLTVRRLSTEAVLELGPEALLLPHGFLQRRIERIPYADLAEVSEVRVSGQTLLQLTTRRRRFTISASLLPDRPSYEAVRDFLMPAR